MAELVALSHVHLETFLLTFCRLGALFAVAPVLGHRAVPVPHRAALALVVAAILTPLLGAGRGPELADLPSLVLAVAGEIGMGLAIGFAAGLVLAAVEGGADLVAAQMGLSFSVFVDPETGGQPTVLARFQQLVALLLFLTLNGHHVLLQAVAASFRRVRPGGVALGAEMGGGLALLGGKVVRAGLEVAAPLVALLLVANVALALLARVAPQTNVFLLGIPVTVALGLVGLLESLPAFRDAVAGLIARMVVDLDMVIRGALGGPR